MAPFEDPKRPEDRNYDEGRFVGWKLIKGVWRPIYEETPAGCFFGALGTFIVLMIGVIWQNLVTLRLIQHYITSQVYL